MSARTTETKIEMSKKYMSISISTMKFAVCLVVKSVREPTRFACTYTACISQYIIVDASLLFTPLRDYPHYLQSETFPLEERVLFLYSSCFNGLV